MNEQKLLTVAVPCYNAQDYMEHCLTTLLSGGEDIEILVVDDGSSDDTAAIADRWASEHPGVVRAIHQENAGHGGAVMTGLRNAGGVYFKVVDSDDWVDTEALGRVMNTLREHAETPVDLVISNYIYDKAGAKHRHVVSYRHALPQGRVFDWEEARRFRKGEYLLMHSVIYRRTLLLECGLELPRHTFYVDELYVYVPLPFVRRIVYVDADLYHYFIGREDQSVQEQVMIRRIDQALRVNRMLVSGADPYAVQNIHLRRYMLNFLEIVTVVSSVLLVKSGTADNLRKKEELWEYIRGENPKVYHTLRHRLLGRLLHLPGRAGQAVILTGYRLCRMIFGFN
mgnify:CR=1 FL=1